MITQEIIQELMLICPESSDVSWKHRDRKYFASDAAYKAWNTKHSGNKIKSTNTKGYIRLTMLGKQYRLHRIVWLHYYGEWPDHIDHIDHDKLNNKISNLRSVTNKENHRNQKKSAANTSGVTGVGWSKRNKKWIARIGVDGEVLSLGNYADKPDAIAARRAGEAKYGFHVNHGI